MYSGKWIPKKDYEKFWNRVSVLHVVFSQDVLSVLNTKLLCHAVVLTGLLHIAHYSGGGSNDNFVLDQP
jgi:hypothetical protein